MSAEVMEFRAAAAVVGRVTDEATGRPIAGARVEVVEYPAAFRDRLHRARHDAGAGWEARAVRLDRARTGPDGAFVLPRLPDGRYELRASLPDAGSRWGPARATVRVVQGRGEAPVRIDLLATAVHGRVTAEDGTPVAMAEVRLAGSGELARTDADGRYTLAGIEPGPRALQVRVRGGAPVSHSVRIAGPGWAVLSNFNLSSTGR